jgi:hypothetical protein
LGFARKSLEWPLVNRRSRAGRRYFLSPRQSLTHGTYTRREASQQVTQCVCVDWPIRQCVRYMESECVVDTSLRKDGFCTVAWRESKEWRLGKWAFFTCSLQRACLMGLQWTTAYLLLGFHMGLNCWAAGPFLRYE